MKHYQIIIAILAAAVSFASCSSSGDETPTYKEPTYTQHESPNWTTQTEEGGTTETVETKYPADLTAYVQLPDSMVYQSNADELAAFCGSECRGVASPIVDEKGKIEEWMVRIYGNVGDKITLEYYCATNKYMYHSVEPIILSNDDRIGTYDYPVTVYMRVEE